MCENAPRDSKEVLPDNSEGKSNYFEKDCLSTVTELNVRNLISSNNLGVF